MPNHLMADDREKHSDNAEPWGCIGCGIKPPRNVTKASVVPGVRSGRTVIVKDYSRSGTLIKYLYGRAVLRREARAYGVLKGVAGIPACLGLEGRDCLVIEYIHGRLLGSYKRGELEACVFDRLDAIVKQAHARGVACGDLHQSNVIITADMRVFLIDFAHAVFASQGSRPGPLARLFMELDRNAVRRMRARYLGQDAPQPAGLFGCVYRFARRLKDARKKIKRCLA